jgi:hypothetical protein
MSLFRRGDVWWYEFWFAGQRIRESTKSASKTVARDAEKNRKRGANCGYYSQFHVFLKEYTHKSPYNHRWHTQ